MMDVRNRLYDRGTLKSFELGARTISVGNLTTGGTGKTPLVALIASMLIDEGEKVCILTRGYGRKQPGRRVLVSDGENVLVDASAGGDEPVELALKLDGRAIIIADPDRVAAARWAREQFDITVFILDDGFQHRRARRDLDIVCIDATNPCGNGRVLPAGTLRESFKGLTRADAIVLTRSDLVESTEDIEARLRARNASALIFKARTKIEGLISIEEPFEWARCKKVEGRLMASTAIGNPASFVEALKRADYDVVGQRSFPDHHRFTEKDIREVEARAKDAGATALVVTAKDAVKLSELRPGLPCYVAIARTIIDDPEGFKKLITSS